MNPANTEHKDTHSHSIPKPGVNLSIVRQLSIENDFSTIDSRRGNAYADGHSSQRDAEMDIGNNRLDKLEVNDQPNEKKLCGIPLNSRFRMAIYSFTYFLSGVTYSLSAPFYPQIATRKGMSLTLIGLVFSVFEMIIFITSPFFGSYLATIGPKFAFTSGIIVAGSCSILFGTLHMCPSGTPFFVLSLLVRGGGAVGFSSFLTSLMAAASTEYPENVATAWSILEGAFGIGMMTGPSIGGVLYTAGGFGTPFYVLGSLVLVEGIFVYFNMPAPEIEPRDKNSGSLLSILRSPLVVIAALGTAIGSTGIGFMEPTLAQHLEPFGLSVILISLFFVISPCAYTLSSPVYGYLSDKKGIYKELIVIGQFIFGIGFLLIGPSSLLPFLPNELWTITLGLFVVGITFGCTVVPNFKCLLFGTMELGFEENMNTYGLVAGVANSSYSLGAFLGPMAGGVLVQAFGDRPAFTVVGLMNIGVSLAACILFAIRRLKGAKGYEKVVTIRRTEETNESTSLIEKSC